MSDGQPVIVFALFPGMTQLDFTGPHQVFSSLPGASVILASAEGGTITSTGGMTFAGLRRLAEIPQCDVVCVPGGHGATDNAIRDDVFLGELRRLAATARFVTSVCTGSLVLGAAGLLQGYRAATHWTALEFLKEFGATPTNTRVCVDRNRVTGGGVTAGIDFALTLVSLLVDRRTAEAIQLRLEYNPAPPFNSGSPETAPADIVAQFRERIASSQARRGAMIKRAAARLAS